MKRTTMENNTMEQTITNETMIKREYIQRLINTASKDKARKHLGCINVNQEKNRLESTNGHIALMVNCEYELVWKGLIMPLLKIPAKITYVVFADSFQSSYLIDKNDNKYPFSAFFGLIDIGMRYPNFDRVMIQKDQLSVNFKSQQPIAFNFKLINDTIMNPAIKGYEEHIEFYFKDNLTEGYSQYQYLEPILIVPCDNSKDVYERDWLAVAMPVRS